MSNDLPYLTGLVIRKSGWMPPRIYRHFQQFSICLDYLSFSLDTPYSNDFSCPFFSSGLVEACPRQHGRLQVLLDPSHHFERCVICIDFFRRLVFVIPCCLRDFCLISDCLIHAYTYTDWTYSRTRRSCFHVASIFLSLLSSRLVGTCGSLLVYLDDRAGSFISPNQQLHSTILIKDARKTT